MPITAFSSFTDGLDPNRRSREHFITNINLEDERLWVPYANGVWFQPCSFNVTSGGFSVVLKGLPGSMVGTHYHVGTVHGYTMRGHWRYLEHDWIAKPGTYIYEPAGEAHTLVITEDSPEPMMRCSWLKAASSIWIRRRMVALLPTRMDSLFSN